MVLEKSFYDDVPSEFSETEQAMFRAVFDRDFAVMVPLLRIGMGPDFLNSVGIPYFEKLDQDKSARGDFPGGRHSILSKDVKD